MKTATRWMFLFVVAVGVGYGASDARAKPKLRCVDSVCMQQCQAAGGANCPGLCRIDCGE